MASSAGSFFPNPAQKAFTPLHTLSRQQVEKASFTPRNPPPPAPPAVAIKNLQSLVSSLKDQVAQQKARIKELEDELQQHARPSPTPQRSTPGPVPCADLLCFNAEGEDCTENNNNNNTAVMLAPESSNAQLLGKQLSLPIKHGFLSC
jgi:hypothetical protein